MWRTSNAPLRHGKYIGLLKNGPATYDYWLLAIGGARRWVHLENYTFAYAFARLLGEGVGEALSYAIVPGPSYINWDSRRTRVRT